MRALSEAGRQVVIGNPLGKPRLRAWHIASPRRISEDFAASVLEHLGSGDPDTACRTQRRRKDKPRPWLSPRRIDHITPTGHGPTITGFFRDFFEMDKDSSCSPMNSNVDLYLYVGPPLDDDDQLLRGASEA
jgi:hypothetical protein